MSNFTSDPLRQVPCRICALSGVDKRVEAKRLSGHIGGAHAKDGWSKASYTARWGPESESDFAFYVPSKNAIAASTVALNEARTKLNEDRNREIPSDTEDLLVDQNLALLRPDERIFYDEFYAKVLQAVDRDEVQMPMISSLTLDMVVLKRLRGAQLEATGGKKIIPTKTLEEAIAQAEKRIQNSMKALSISREMLVKNREQIRSTAAGLISGYLDEIERNSVEALDALMIDEKRVLARMQPRIEKMILALAKDLEPEETKEEEDGTTGAVFSIEDALQRAGVSFEG